MKLAKDFAPVDVIILDCFYVAYRGYCATPPLTSADGTPTNAIHGLLGAARRMIKELQPKSVIVVTESRTSFREQLHPQYKEGRVLPSEFAVQVPLFHEMCRLQGWHLLEREGYEADDVAASVIRKLNERGLKAAVFTTDKDIISLCNDRIGIYKTEKGKAYIQEPADYQAKWGVPPTQIPQVLMLCGDSVDNVPGVKGVGLKTAVRLIQQFESIDNLMANLPKVEPEKLRNLLASNAALIELSKSLITLRDDTALDDAILQPGTQQTQQLTAFFRGLDMNKSAEAVLAESAPKQTELVTV